MGGWGGGGLKWGGGVRGGRPDIWTARISVAGLFHMADLCPDRNPPLPPTSGSWVQEAPGSQQDRVPW